MSLNGALQIGRSGLVASQAALQVAGNNMANAATPGFHRRSVQLTPARGQVAGRGQFIGQGVNIADIRREVDGALQARMREALGDEHAATSEHQFLGSIEALQNELTDNDLSSLLSTFFNSFSEAANNPSDRAVRSVVIQQGLGLAGKIADLRGDYSNLVGDVDRRIASTVDVANGLLDQIEAVNGEIARAESGVGEASALRDRRDQLIDELAHHLDVTVVEQQGGSVDILVNSIPILLAGKSRGLEARTESVAGGLELTIRVAADGTELNVQSGTIGGLLRQRGQNGSIPAIDTLDQLASELIFQVNRLHSQGQGETGFASITGTNSVKDTTANLNSTAADLPFSIENGSFFIHVTHRETGVRSSFRIDVDGNADSLDDLVTQINTVVAVPNVTASESPDKALTLTADPGFEISFSDDTSGALAALGVNTFFTGTGASTIGVNDALVNDPGRLALGQDHVPGSNGTALAIAGLQDQPVDALGSSTLREFWQQAVNDLAVQTAASESESQSASLVRESLDAQIQATSGVSLDEESINLLTFQRQFQAAARFITVIDQTLQVLMTLV